MIDSFLGEQWSLIAFIFFGIIAYISWIRWRDHRWIESQYDKSRVVAMSFGVNYFGKESEPGRPDRSSGFLVLLKDRLVYRSRWKKQLVEIPGSDIIKIYPDSAHKGVDLHQSVLIVVFEIEPGEKDAVAFRVPYPPQWLNAIRNISPRMKTETN